MALEAPLPTDLDAPLTDDERERLIDSVAQEVVRRGLSVPAILALEMHRPMAFVLGQGVVAAIPLIGPLLGLERMRGAARLMTAPGGIEALIRRIEDLTVERDAPSAPATPSARNHSL